MKSKSFIALIVCILFAAFIAFADEVVSPALAPDPDIQLLPRMSVSITSDRQPIMRVGQIVHLTSQLIGFDGYELSYQWECDKNDGNGFQPVLGATSNHYEFEATKETLSWSWRLAVNYR